MDICVPEVAQFLFCLLFLYELKIISTNGIISRKSNDKGTNKLSTLAIFCNRQLTRHFVTNILLPCANFLLRCHRHGLSYELQNGLV